MDYFQGRKKLIIFLFAFIAVAMGFGTIFLLPLLKVWTASLYGTVQISATVPLAAKNVTFSPVQGGSTFVATNDGNTVGFSFPENFSNASANIQLRATV